jgi:hypothetical protein
VDFRWNEWNIEHVGRHGVTPEMAEEVLQVVFVLDEDGSIYVLHARPLTDTEKRRYRRHGR